MPASDDRSQPANGTSDTPAVSDVAKSRPVCHKYCAGHYVHYIPVLHLVPDLRPEAAIVECTDDGITLTIDDLRIPLFSHDPARIRALVGELGPACHWYPTLHLASWPGAGVRHWASLALAPVGPCSSAEDVHISELRYGS